RCGATFPRRDQTVGVARGVVKRPHDGLHANLCTRPNRWIRAPHQSRARCTVPCPACYTRDLRSSARPLPARVVLGGDQIFLRCAFETRRVQGSRMAQRSRPTITKRQREQARIAKQKDKAARRAEKSAKKERTPVTP